MRALLAVLLLLGLASPASAHRLDEYLQATTIALQKDRVELRLHLTPGVDVVPKVLASIDSDGDGRLSAAEQHAYAQQVRGNLLLTVDGSPRPLRLASSSFPPVETMRRGLGDMLLVFRADMPVGAATHSLQLRNRHESGIAVYLVNTLEPRDPAVRILGQDRNYNQSSYRLDFSVDANFRGRAASSASDLGREDALSLVGTYFWHGIHHILTGYDHLLFVVALVLGAATLWDLVKVVTVFTMAHSITLALAALDLVHLPAAVVEPLIAASIVFVAAQNIFWPNEARGASRLAVAFFFGLFHGLGFAGGLLDIMHQMPTGTILLAILGFSFGIEAGNQIVLLPLFGALMALRRVRPDDAAREHLSSAIRRAGSAGVSLAGAFYLVAALGGSV